MTAESWRRYWGKAQPEPEEQVPDHPLVFHNLDVAACGQVWLERNPAFVAMLAGWLGQTPEATRQLLVFLLAVHDIGKFAESFQYKVPALVKSRFEPPLPLRTGSLRHDAIGALFFDWLAEDRALPAAMQLPGSNADAWKVLLAPAFGHHGVPPVTETGTGAGAARARLREHMSAASREVAAGFFDWCAGFFLRTTLTACSTPGAQLASWWIAGLAVLADWLGSNTTWFPYAEPAQRALSLERYWQNVALPRARQAIEESGVLSVRPRRYCSPHALLPGLKGKTLRPAQQLAADWTISDEPHLFVLEDATGSGKTEASLILAARLIDAGLADGLFFGLPTQATADQMFERVTADVPHWFDDPSRATLVLAHGARDQSHAFQAHLAQRDDDIPGEGGSATLRLTDWLAQSNKRALLAQVGVGTLDQALLAGLRVRHQSLRMLGLWRKVLIVDEVHSYDPYMTRVLLQTLELHAASGGSAILLSATLPRVLRSQLLDAYARGIARVRKLAEGTRGRRSPARTSLEAKSADYPLLTHWAPSLGVMPREQAFPAAAHSRRRIAIDYVTREEDVLARIAAWHAAGQAVVWIRNTVADACAAWERLCERFGADACTLFHARFAGVDRRRIQNDVLAALGRDSHAGQRRGRIIVTTQVFQESLDVDADQMVCDLCPVDVLLQRLGRYRRHLRDGAGNRLPADAACDGRVPGPVVVFGPDREAEPDKDWYLRFSRGGARVYAAHGVLYRTALAIGTRIVLPGQFRQLVEAVYGEDGEPIPPALQTAEDRALGVVASQQMLAQLNTIGLAGGYGSAEWHDEEHIGTRLGESIEAVLVRVDGSVLYPWAQGHCEPGEDPWALSGIRVPGHWLRGCGESVAYADPGLVAQVEQLKSRHPALKYRLALPLARAADGSWHCTLAGQPPLRLRYCDRRGLERLQ